MVSSGLSAGFGGGMSQALFDYVIVGAGSAGCVLADRLSQDAGANVLVVESGPPDRSPLIAMPMGIGKLGTSEPQHYWRYPVSKGGNREEETWIKGRTLGGSSSVNGMVYVRGMPADYDRWERGGAAGWGWATIGRCFRSIEDHELGPAEWRGAGGPLRVTVPRHRDPLAEAVIAAAGEAGAPIVPDINDPATQANGGFGRQPCTISKGRRFSAADAFLRPALARRNLTVMTDSDVTAILFEGRRACGVRIRGRHGVREILVRREVILSAGAVHSPKLLQLAGIGPGEVLRGAGVAVRVDSRGVGRNLREHRTISVAYRLTRGGKNAALRGGGLYLSALRYFLLRQGALTSATFDVGGFVKTLPGLDRADGQVGVGLFSFGPDGAISAHPGLTMFGYFMRPDSQGVLAIRSPAPDAPLMIDANYLATERDRRHTVALMRKIRQIGAQPALERYVAEEILPGNKEASDEELVEASFAYGTSGFHVAGTCRMGTDPGSVVDTELRVRGVDGLRVVDTSVMPELSGNTNAPAMAIAWRAAELITQAWRTGA